MDQVEESFHTPVGGCDQPYSDDIAREPELRDWVRTTKRGKKRKRQFTGALIAVDKIYFNHYCQTFQSGIFAYPVR